MTERDKKPKRLAGIVTLDAWRRAQEAQQRRQNTGTHDVVEERQARHRRRERLWHAEPAITDDDIRRLECDDHMPWRDFEAMAPDASRHYIGDYPHMVHVMEWWETTTPILFLSGTVGRCKTVAACWALARGGGAYLRAADMWRVFESFDSSEQVRILGARVLVLDDLGREKVRAKGLGYLESILDDRRSRGRRTIITTNIDATKIQDEYRDDRLWSRVKQSFVWKADKGPDLRGPK